MSSSPSLLAINVTTFSTLVVNLLVLFFALNIIAIEQGKLNVHTGMEIADKIRPSRFVSYGADVLASNIATTID
ncbi:hypothetical protein [Vibrio cincinnatiensis]